MQDDVKLPSESAQQAVTDPPQPAPISDIVQNPSEQVPSEEPHKEENLEKQDRSQKETAPTPELPKPKKNHHIIPIIFAVLILLGLGAIAVIAGTNK